MWRSSHLRRQDCFFMAMIYVKVNAIRISSKSSLAYSNISCRATLTPPPPPPVESPCNSDTSAGGTTVIEMDQPIIYYLLEQKWLRF